jgi:tricorn protease-like protein
MHTTAQKIDLTDTRMMKQPAVSENQIAFIYAEDLWVANLDGSQPKRLTVDEGVESNQAFLPMVKPLPLVPSTMAMWMFILLLPRWHTQKTDLASFI